MALQKYWAPFLLTWPMMEVVGKICFGEILENVMNKYNIEVCKKNDVLDDIVRYAIELASINLLVFKAEVLQYERKFFLRFNPYC